MPRAGSWTACTRWDGAEARLRDSGAMAVECAPSRPVNRSMHCLSSASFGSSMASPIARLILSFLSKCTQPCCRERFDFGKSCRIVQGSRGIGLPPLLEQISAVARISPYHFARQFKAATGLSPHQYVIIRRIERAKQLLRARTDLSLAEVATCAGFSDQSQFSHHFKRIVGVTPKQFQIPARIA